MSVSKSILVGLLACAQLAACGKSASPVPPVVTAVTSTQPDNNATGVGLDWVVTANFNGAMDPASITSATFGCTRGASAVSGAVSYTGTTATFKPATDFAANTTYTATVTTGAKSVSGTALPTAIVWNFTTGAQVIGPTPPTISATVPAGAATGVQVSTTISATFSKAMLASSISGTTFTVKQGSTAVAGAASVAGTTATFTPAASLAPGTFYTATITAAVTDASGVALAADYSWSFATAAGAPPASGFSIVSTVPSINATGVLISEPVSAIFSLDLKPTTLNSTTFTLKQGLTRVDGAVTYSSATRQATFTPAGKLLPGLVYTATLTAAVEDATGAALGLDSSWSFGTLPIPAVASTTPGAKAFAVPVGSSVNAVFNEAMDPQSINALTFTLSQGGTLVPGTVGYLAATHQATFTPAASLSASAVYRATIKGGVTNASGSPLGADYTWYFSTGTAPLVVSTSPQDAAVSVSVNLPLTVVFSEPMDPATLSSTTFMLTVGGKSVGGAVSYSSTAFAATFTPSSPLPQYASCTATITTSATSVNGTALAASYSWSVTAGEGAGVVGVTPARDATGVSIDPSLSAQFDEQMEPFSFNSKSFTLTQGTTVIPASVGYQPGTLTGTLGPTAPLGWGLVYTATLSTDVRNSIGAYLDAPYSWSFTTATGPTVALVFPADHTIDVPLDAIPTANFSAPMDPTTFNATTFTLTQGGSPVAGTVSSGGDPQLVTAALFTPAAPLQGGTVYTASLTAGARSSAGMFTNGDSRPLTPFSWTFTTVSPPPVDLGNYTPLAIVSAGGLTSTGVTVTYGHVALNPTASCTDLSGKSGSTSCLAGKYVNASGLTVNNYIFYPHDTFDNGTTASGASATFVSAYKQGFAKTDTQTTIAGNELASKTLTAGVYHVPSLSLAAGGTVTLDGQNGPNPVFIFKVDGNLTGADSSAGASQIVLTNGALARKVFFFVGGDATIGRLTSWKGSVFAGGNVTVNDGATVTGHLLAGGKGAGAVSLHGAAANVTTISTLE